MAACSRRARNMTCIPRLQVATLGGRQIVSLADYRAIVCNVGLFVHDPLVRKFKARFKACWGGCTLDAAAARAGAARRGRKRNARPKSFAKKLIKGSFTQGAPKKVGADAVIQSKVLLESRGPLPPCSVPSACLVVHVGTPDS